jgi:hypothetical protein
MIAIDAVDELVEVAIPKKDKLRTTTVQVSRW